MFDWLIDQLFGSNRFLVAALVFKILASLLSKNGFYASIYERLPE